MLWKTKSPEINCLTVLALIQELEWQQPYLEEKNTESPTGTRFGCYDAIKWLLSVVITTTLHSTIVKRVKLLLGITFS